MGKKLRFNNGKFKIMQITDIQDTISISRDTLNFIEKALDTEKPDLVVFTGDQLKGYDHRFRGKNGKVNIENSIETILKPVVSRNIPFAATFGNHDAQKTILDENEQFKLYKKYENSYCFDNDEVEGSGTYNVPIYNDNDEMIFNLYIINSHGFTGKLGHYSSVTDEQISWLKNTKEKLKNSNDGKYVPSFVFQHIPVYEMINLLKRVKLFTKGSVIADGKFNYKSYVLNENCFEKTLFGETPAVSLDRNDEFNVAAENGDVIGMFFGHDHLNAFVGKYENVDLGYCPGCGFKTYGAGFERGVRVFELDENDIRNYKTRIIKYKDYFGKKIKEPLVYFANLFSPPNEAAGAIMTFKILGALIAITIIIYMIIHFGG